MSLRILAGELKGRKLLSPSGPLTKPSLSLIRKATFDICRGFLPDARFLDLFACSGAMGIEALSQGAGFASFIEKDPKTARVLKENLRTLSLETKAEVLVTDAFSGFSRCKHSPYDIVYIDPPYPLSQEKPDAIRSLLLALDTSNLLADSCIVFLEEASPPTVLPTSDPFPSLRYVNGRLFGGSFLHQLRRD